MISAILSFLGGSAFRMIWGEVSAWMNKKLEHEQEIARMKLQEELEANKHVRQQELIKMQHELGIKEIQVAGEVAVDKEAAVAFTEAMKTAQENSGITWVDAWNKSMRPTVYSIAVLMWISSFVRAGFIPSEFDLALISTSLGF